MPTSAALFASALFIFLTKLQLGCAAEVQIVKIDNYRPLGHAPSPKPQLAGIA